MRLMKKNVLFVGAFNNNNKDGSTGGQLYACLSLINSDLKNEFNFIKIDSTSTTVPVPNLIVRAFKALLRLIKFLAAILFKEINSVLIFSADSFSFIEKGLMVFIARCFSKKVIFAPRSGMSINDYKGSKFMRFYMKTVIKFSSVVICQGSYWLNFYAKMDSKNSSKFIIIHNWIKISQFKKIKHKISDSKFKILYIGWLEEYKGILDLIEALSILKKKDKNFKCEIYGGGSIEDKIKFKISKYKINDSVFLKGWADKKDKIEAFKQSNIFILPSHFEGFPNSLLEAMSAEMPVIASRVGAVADIINHNINGLIYTPKDISQLAKNIEILMENKSLRSKLALNARNTVMENFTINQAVKKIKKVL